MVDPYHLKGKNLTYVCVFVCACVCVCVMERLLPQFQAWLIGAWCSVYTYSFAKVHIKIVWVCCIHPARLKPLGLLILCFLVSASSAAAPSNRLAAVRIEGIKGEVFYRMCNPCLDFLLSRRPSGVKKSI